MRLTHTHSQGAKKMKLILELDNLQSKEEAQAWLVEIKEMLGSSLTGLPNQRLELTAKVEDDGEVKYADEVLDIDW